MLVGKCPWCGCLIIDGRAFETEFHLILEQLESALPKWGIARHDALPARQQPEATPAIDLLLNVIEHLGQDAAQAIPLLLAALKDPDGDVRRAAAIALGRMGPEAKSALPALSVLLRDRDELVRDAAADAIHKIMDE